MFRREACILTLLFLPALAQSVISTRAGLIDYLNGTVTIDGREVPAIRGRFPDIPPGSLLRTAEGNAEVVLNPEVFLWLGPHSAMRMHQNNLSDTRVEVVEGYAVVESTELPPGDSVTVMYSGSELRLPAHSLYRAGAASIATALPGELDRWIRDRRALIAATRLPESASKAKRPVVRPHPALTAPLPGRH